MKRAALFVGVNRYEDPEINNLDCAESDATELYAFFKHRAAYDDVRHLLSPDSDRLLDTAHDMAARLDPDDLFLFFFAGHGVEHEGRHLLLCPRARYSRLKYHQHAVPLDLLKQETARSGLHRVLILDACRTDLLRGQRSAGGTGLRDVQCLRAMVAPEGAGKGALAIVCSCDEGQQAREMPSYRQGLFTHALLDVLMVAERTGGQIFLCDAFEKDLVEGMSGLALRSGFPSEQRPWIQRSGALPAVLSFSRHATYNVPMAQNPVQVLCPLCGAVNRESDTFACTVCSRNCLCKGHDPDGKAVCVECAAKARSAGEPAEYRVAEENQLQARLLSDLSALQSRKIAEEQSRKLEYWRLRSVLIRRAEMLSRMGAIVACPHCRSPIAGAWSYCAACGKNVSERTCRGCGHVVNKMWKFCPYCEKALASDVATQVGRLSEQLLPDNERR